MISEATEMSKPVWRGRPSSSLPRPTTTFRRARSLTSTTRRQVMLSAREMTQSRLPAPAKTWINEKLVYDLWIPKKEQVVGWLREAIQEQDVGNTG